VHNVRKWPDLRYLGEPLGGAEGLLETVSFKEATEIVHGYWSPYTPQDDDSVKRWVYGPLPQKLGDTRMYSVKLRL